MSYNKKSVGHQPMTPEKGGVGYFQQFPKNFLRPYGEVDPAPTEAVVFKRTQPFSCEWLTRPKIAMSELAETIRKEFGIALDKTLSGD